MVSGPLRGLDSWQVRAEGAGLRDFLLSLSRRPLTLQWTFPSPPGGWCTAGILSNIDREPQIVGWGPPRRLTAHLSSREAKAGAFRETEVGLSAQAGT